MMVEEADGNEGMRNQVKNVAGLQKNGAFCSQNNNLERQMVLSSSTEYEDSEIGDSSGSEEEFTPEPLCVIFPGIEWNHKSSDWVLRKVDEIKDCVGVSCDGFEEQFRALLIAIEVGQPSLDRSAVKKERELKRLSCLVNYNGKGGSVLRNKGKERAVTDYK